ncbi:hypothetical protein VTI74DRAFT_4513 [Chaetomium olivicolor]
MGYGPIVDLRWQEHLALRKPIVWKVSLKLLFPYRDTCPPGSYRSLAPLQFNETGAAAGARLLHWTERNGCVKLKWREQHWTQPKKKGLRIFIPPWSICSGLRVVEEKAPVVFEHHPPVHPDPLPKVFCPVRALPSFSKPAEVPPTASSPGSSPSPIIFPHS